jgi:hypothetical protein
MVEREKEEFMSQIEHYRAVLDDLQRQKNLYQFKIVELDNAIASLHRLIPDDAKEALPAAPIANTPAVTVVRGKYAGMSVRWAILNLLAEDASHPMSTGAIAVALQQGGITSAGKNFAGNVSAVLSDMGRVRHEVLSGDSGWVITETGKSAWAHISAKRRAQQQQFTISSNVQ